MITNIIKFILIFALTNLYLNAKETVVLLHGLGRGNMSMWLIASRLEDANFNVVRVGYSSLNETPDEILKNITKQINICCSKKEEKVNLVGHSLGGLLIRAYLEKNKIKNLGRVVLMGTPNHGTELVDKYKDKCWMKWAGPTALKLGTDSKSFPQSLKAPYYPVGIIAGVLLDGDEVYSILSDNNDGMVSVESTKLDGMSDFIKIETSHSAMRYNKEVASQTISFLRNGKFMR